MSYCLKPNCKHPENPNSAENCQTCGAVLRLQQRCFAIKPIGQGGFGRTFVAIDASRSPQTRCVIKQFYPQQQGSDNLAKASELFRQEAQRLRELGSHAQIPTLLSYTEQDGYQYLIQEFIDGHTLEQELAGRRVFSEQDVRQLLQALLPVVQFIHNHQVIHRDIKPANIIRRASDQVLFLVDLGAAKQATGTALAKTGTVIGSAEYTAPEQARGKAVFASDLYSLGVTCIHLLTGMSPFDLFDSGNGCWVWQDYLQQPVSNSLKVILNKMLQQATNLRYQSAAEVLEALSPRKSQTIHNRSDELLIEPKHSHRSNQIDLAEREADGRLNINGEQAGQIIPAATHKTLQRKGGWRKPVPHRQNPLMVTLSVVVGLYCVFGFFVALATLIQWKNPSSNTSTPLFQSRSPYTPLIQEPTPKFSNPVQPNRSFNSQGLITSLAISSDGKTLVSGNDSSRAFAAPELKSSQPNQQTNTSSTQVWHLQTGSLISTLPSQYPVWSVAISPDGKTIASQSASMTVNTNQSLSTALTGETQLWQADSGKLRHTLPVSFPGVSLAFSRDGKLLATELKQGTGIWEVATGQQVKMLNSSSRAIAFSPDHLTLVTASDPGQAALYVWDWRNGRLVANLNSAKQQASLSGWYRSLAFSSDGQMLVAGFNGFVNSFVQTWDTSTYQPGRRFDQSGKVLSVAISPDQRLIASAGSMNGAIIGKVNLWDARTGELLRSLQLPGTVMAVMFTPDGNQLICGGLDQQITFWQVEQLISGH